MLSWGHAAVRGVLPTRALRGVETRALRGVDWNGEERGLR